MKNLGKITRLQKLELAAMLIVLLVALSLMLLVPSVTGTANAVVSDINYPMTDTDTFTYNGNTYLIDNFTVTNSTTYAGDYINNLYKSTSNMSDDANDNSLILMASADDPIVNIVPRELFTSVNITLYFGLEYGFFIETKKMPNTEYNYRSTVIVFDIEFTV
ncbi:MAG: hypothetical protein LBT55_05405 [Clostridiaceae bacterium]|jgi:hypothetical protein|nr:hypothetical protein [Clostridiaceae bacterium]